MGSKAKARELLEKSQAHSHYSTIVEYALTYFIARAEVENEPFADYLKALREKYKEQFAKAIEVTEDIYAEMFTDAEMDELIVLQTNPAMEKLRALTTTIFNEVLEKHSLPVS